jgi:hypothetical protein
MYCMGGMSGSDYTFRTDFIALVLRHWTFFLILKAHHLGFSRNVLPPLESKLLVMRKRIGEAMKMVYRTCQLQKHGIGTNRSGATQYSVQRFMVFSLSYIILTLHWHYFLN